MYIYIYLCPILQLSLTLPPLSSLLPSLFRLGFFFCPIQPVVILLTTFLLFYVKRVSKLISGNLKLKYVVAASIIPFPVEIITNIVATSSSPLSPTFLLSSPLSPPLLLLVSSPPPPCLLPSSSLSPPLLLLVLLSPPPCLLPSSYLSSSLLLLVSSPPPTCPPLSSSLSPPLLLLVLLSPPPCLLPSSSLSPPLLLLVLLSPTV